MINYLAGNGFPSPADPGPADRGANFFSGGTNVTSTMTQKIDVGNLAGKIGNGQVSFLLSAWLGGFSNQTDTATVIAHFLDSSNTEIGSSQLAPRHGRRTRQRHQASCFVSSSAVCRR